VSRIGRLPVTVPAGVEVDIQGYEVKVKGPRGEMKHLVPAVISIKREGEQILVTRESDEPMVRSLHGTTRALINNMVTGVSTGFTKILEIQGVGWSAGRNEASGSRCDIHQARG